MRSSLSSQKILITGATGYIGGRLIPVLLDKGADIRVLVRNAETASSRSWGGSVEIIEGDVFDKTSLELALEGVSSAYYFIHSMVAHGENFRNRDLVAASNFGQAAKKQNVDRIIYLGGLGSSADNLSKHLQSRHETGAELAKYGVPVTELRAAIIVGSGSVSFEMVRYLTERLPIMICPKWVFTRVQPIGINDVLDYLIASLTNENATGKVIEIGGADILTYGQMMGEFAEIRGLRRLLIPVPVLTPRLSSYWVHWFSPIPASITRPLVEGLKNEVIVRDESARDIFSDIHPISYREAVEDALESIRGRLVESRWSDAFVSSVGDSKPVMLANLEGMIIEKRTLKVDTTGENLFNIYSNLGGETGWLFLNWTWRLRGAMDRLIGGVGLRRGRRDPQELRVGDAMDFWRVEELIPGRRLRLRAEMKVPGLAWLQFESEKLDQNQSKLIQTAFFAPKGLLGFLYWYVLYPIHSLIFSGMARKIVAIAEGNDAK